MTQQQGSSLPNNNSSNSNNIMSLQVFADLMSQPARAVAIFCRAASIKHELVNVSRIKIAEVDRL